MTLAAIYYMSQDIKNACVSNNVILGPEELKATHDQSNCVGGVLRHKQADRLQMIMGGQPENWIIGSRSSDCMSRIVMGIH